MSIQDMGQKIKSFATSDRGRDSAVIGIVIFTGIICFVLGRLSIADGQGSGVVISGGAAAIGATLLDQKPTYSNNLDQLTEVGGSSSLQVLNSQSYSTAPTTQKGLYVASSRGKKYYPVDCPAAKGLSPKNLIYYNTAMEAEKAGKSLSSSCN